MLDIEHSGRSFETIEQQIAHAHGAGLVPIVKPRGGHRFAEHELLLDLGAQGLIVPWVETGAEAAAIVRGTRDPPDGTRAWRRCAALAREQGRSRSAGEPISARPMVIPAAPP